MKHGNLTLGQIEAIINKLGGEERATRFLRGELVVQEANQIEFPIWKRVKVGNLGNAETARERLRDAAVPIGYVGNDVLDYMTFEDTEAMLDLVRVSAEELGLKDSATTAEIYAAAERQGLSLCPAEVAPQLWLQHSDQFYRDELTMAAMEPVKYLDVKHLVFHVVNRHATYILDAGGGHPNRSWNCSFHWVFVKQRK